MAQQIGDLLERRAALHQPTGQGVAQDMRAADAILESAAFRRIAHRIAHDIRSGRSVDRGTMAHEQFTTRRGRAARLQIRRNRTRGGFGQRKRLT